MLWVNKTKWVDPLSLLPNRIVCVTAQKLMTGIRACSLRLVKWDSEVAEDESAWCL